jgi:aspartate/methionine/tyrosine aminotransferase
MENLENLKTMRDINDYCVKRNIPSLAQGMIELPPSELLRKIAGEVALNPNVHTYRCRSGEPQYIEGIQHLLKEDQNTNVQFNEILATQGVSGGIVATLALIKDRGGSRIGLVEPFYTYHVFQIKRIFGEDIKIDFIKSHDHSTFFAPNWDEIEKAMKVIDMILLCNPGNPSGRVWKKDELQRLLELAKERNVMVLIDECYTDMVWKPNVHYSPVQDAVQDNLVVVRGFSKTLGLQSWRLGFAISSATTVANLMKVADPIYICVPFLQHAVGKYLTEHFEDFTSHKAAVGEQMCRNWTVLSSSLQKTFGWEPINPSGSMYGMFLHKSENDMAAVKLALEKGVGVCPGSMFFNGTENTGYVRIHCGVSDEKTKKIVDNLDYLNSHGDLVIENK